MNAIRSKKLSGDKLMGGYLAISLHDSAHRLQTLAHSFIKSSSNLSQASAHSSQISAVIPHVWG
jgi:hypothetical protein